MMRPLRNKDIHIIDEHHEAFSLWEDFLPELSNSTLFHVDSHSDTDTPILSNSVYDTASLRTIAQNQLSIDTFIIPAILLGKYSRVLYINPRGHEQKTRSRTIGSVNGNGIIIRVDVSNSQIFPDLRGWQYTVTSKVGSFENDAVLDIDLDYFSCNLFIHPQFELKISEVQAQYLNSYNKSVHPNAYRLGLYDATADTLHFKQNPTNLIFNDSEKTIDYAVKKFVYDLKINPIFVNICRSVKTGYTPSKWATYVEDKLISCLTDPPVDKPKYMFDIIEIYPFIGFHGNTLYNPITSRYFELTSEEDIFVWRKLLDQRNYTETTEIMCAEFGYTKSKAIGVTYKSLMFLKEHMIVR